MTDDQILLMMKDRECAMSKNAGNLTTKPDRTHKVRYYFEIAGGDPVGHLWAEHMLRIGDTVSLNEQTFMIICDMIMRAGSMVVLLEPEFSEV